MFAAVHVRKEEQDSDKQGQEWRDGDKQGEKKKDELQKKKRKVWQMNVSEWHFAAANVRKEKEEWDKQRQEEGDQQEEQGPALRKRRTRSREEDKGKDE